MKFVKLQPLDGNSTIWMRTDRIESVNVFGNIVHVVLEHQAPAHSRYVEVAGPAEDIIEAIKQANDN